MYYTRLRVFAFMLPTIHMFYRLPVAIVSDLTATVAAAERNPNADGNFHVGDGVSQPKLVYGPEPQATQEARQKHIKGTVVVWTIVAEDGNPKDVHVARSVGEDLSPQNKYLAGPLDGNAVNCVQQYRYEPARFKGKQVSVQIEIKISYKE
jgi:TonB family protein